MFSGSEGSVRTDDTNVEPPPIPKTRGPLLFEGVRLAGGPPRRTPKRSCSRYFSVTRKTTSAGTDECEHAPPGFSLVNTPSTQDVSPSAKMELPCSAAAHYDDDDDDDDIIPSTAPLPTPHPVMHRVLATGQPNGVSRLLPFDEYVVEEVTPRKCSSISADTSGAAPSTPQGTELREVTQVEEQSPLPAVPEMCESPTRFTLGPRLPVNGEKVRMDFYFLQQEVDAWAKPIETTADVEWHKQHLQETRVAMRSLLHELEVLIAREAAEHERLCIARGFSAMESTSDGKCTYAGETDVVSETRGKEWKQEELETLEAWRVEKGALLAQKSKLLREHQELQYRLRSHLSGSATGRVTPSPNTSVSRSNKSRGDEGNIGGMSTPLDNGVAQLRLEISEMNAKLKKLEDAYKVLHDNQQWRQGEFDDEYGALCRALATATAGEINNRTALQDTIREAEGVRANCLRQGDASLVSLMERGLSEAKAALKCHDTEQYETK